jgi:hypothetical protein
MDGPDELRDLDRIRPRRTTPTRHRAAPAPDPLIELMCRALEDFALMLEHQHADLVHIRQHLGIPAPGCAAPPATT